MGKFCVVAGFLTLVPFATHGQSINVDFGAGPVPDAGYAAAGLAGAWNAVVVLPPGERAPLVGLDGNPSAARIYMIGGTALFAADDPSTTGDHESLVDDMLIGFNDPLDVCIWFENLENGDYEVLLYGITPSAPAETNRVRVDFAAPGPTIIGGAWPGQHVAGVTFQAFQVAVTTGKIGLHSGDPGAEIQSGLNGIQLRPLSATEVGVAPAPSATSIRGVFPNPAGIPQTIELAVGTSGPFDLQIFDVAGRLVWQEALGHMEPGRRSVVWNGSDLLGRRVPASVYFLRLTVESVQRSGPVRVIRLN